MATVSLRRRHPVPATWVHPRHRFSSIRVLLVLVSVIVVLRLVQIQIIDQHRYGSAGEGEITQTVITNAMRGEIADRNGLALAVSKQGEMVIADDFQISDPVSEAATLSGLLGVAVATLEPKLRERSGYVKLSDFVSRTLGAKVASLNLPGITLAHQQRRVYPNSTLAGSLLGGVNASGTGSGGLEYQYNKLLAGQNGSKTLLESPTGVQLPGSVVRITSRAIPGTGLELTIDTPLQYSVESALAAEIVASHATSGEAVVEDVKTGQILAMANLDANTTTATITTNGQVATQDSTISPSPTTIGPKQPVVQASSNLVVDQLYEPGSTFKIVTFSAALGAGIITPTTEFSVPGKLSVDGSTFHDAEIHATETLSATQILAKSSNIGTAEIAQQLGEQRLLDQVTKLGFGVTDGFNFPGTSAGLLIDAKTWEPTDIVSLPIGQVDAVSALEVLGAYNAIANGGTYVDPSLVKATVGPRNRLRSARTGRMHRVLSATVAAEMTQMLEHVVADPTATGGLAAVPGYSVAGKTGTAQIPTAGGAGYQSGAYMASFVGFAPATHPVLSAIVVLDHPTPIYGGATAAPTFAKIMSYALHRYDVATTPGAPVASPTPAASVNAVSQDVTW